MEAMEAMEAWIAGYLPFLDALETRLKRAVHPQDHLLQDLRVDLTVFRHSFFYARQLGILPIVGNSATTHPPCFLTLASRSVVDVAAEHERTIESTVNHLHLLWRRREFALRGLEGVGDRLRFHPRAILPDWRKIGARCFIRGPTWATQRSSPCLMAGGFRRFLLIVS
jgi:hypothetical protein